MGLLGDAAVAMWWEVAEEHCIEFHEWHSKEHLPERLGLPGFRRGSRWQVQGGAEFFVLYELDAYETLTSPAYRDRLNNPTPWSVKMMPRHRNMVRSQCRVLASHGGGVATFMSTIRLSPAPGQERRLESFLAASIEQLPSRAGLTGAHLLFTDTPKAGETKEQRIRGADAVADWIVLVSGADADVLRDIAQSTLGTEALRDNGAAGWLAGEPYRLVHVMSELDVRPKVA